MTWQIFSIEVAAGIIAALLGWRIWRMFRPDASWLDHPAIFFVLVFAAILVLRLPQIGWVHEINVDESQLLAQGMRYMSHPVPWRDVDGTTSGPLDSLLLTLPMDLGAPGSWATARTVLWGTQCATMIFIYLALRHFGTRAEAQLALMPTILFYAFADEPGFTYYSSEALPVLLLSVMLWLLGRAWVTERFSQSAIFFTGFLAGCIPFTKLQAGPLAVFPWAVGLAQIIFARREHWRSRAALMLLGAAVFPVLLLGTVVACGAGNDFWTSYILAPSAYTRESLEKKVDFLWTLFASSTNFRSYFISALATGILLLAACCHVRKPKLGVKLFASLMAILALGVLSVFCMAVSGKGYEHYLLLLIPAQAVFFGLVLAAGKKALLFSEPPDPQLFPKPIHWFLAAFALVISFQAVKVPAYFNTTYSYLAHRTAERKSFVARRIIKASEPGDTLSIWGWMPSYYVETGLTPGTRDAIGHFIIEDGPYRDYYRRRYLNDLKQNRPAFFVDAMAWGVFTYSWPTLTPHEYFPELDKFIQDGYSLWVTVYIITAKGVGVPVRIYVLNQRMTKLHLAPEVLQIPMDPSLAPE